LGIKKYKTILVDPPWQVKAGRDISGYKVVNGKQVFTQEHQKSRELAYPTMSIHEISSLPIADLASPNCHLYLWTINKYVNDAYSIAKRWGFSPSTLLVWAKNPMGGGLGGAFGISTEFILFSRKGTLPAKQKIKGTWWNWKRPYDKRGKPKHSAKPEAFQTIIESVSPGPYLEMFARRKRFGWDSWGNEIECDVDCNVGIDISFSTPSF